MANNTFLIGDHTNSDPDTWQELGTLLDDGEATLPEWEYQPYSNYVTLGNGKRKGVGYPVIKWSFKGLRPLQREALRAYCQDISSAVYIRTAVNDTTSGARDWRDFDCLMNWVERAEVVDDGIEVVRMTDITFTFCIDITGD